MSLALKKSAEKEFLSSEKKIKKKIKKGKIEIKESNDKKKKDYAYKNRGVVYLSHIPHGFYEDQMKQYFSQFGKVTRLRLARSQKTGRSKGYAFIEFEFAEVAKIAAETMHNYLMFKRLLKARYIPPEENKNGMFIGKDWRKNYFPKLIERKKMISQKNSQKTEEQEKNLVKKALKKVSKVNAMLKKMGIDYHFKPIDVPSFKDEKESTEDNKGSIDNQLEDDSSSVDDDMFGDSSDNLELMSDDDNSKESTSDSDEPYLDIDPSEDEIEFVTPPNVKKRFIKQQVSKSIEKDPGKFVKNMLSVNKNPLIKKQKDGGIVKKSKNVTKVPKKEQMKVKKLIANILDSNDVVVKASSTLGQKSKNKNKKI